MTRLIKKYKNRRLYDTEKSQYITIEELEHYVVNNIPFKVIDSSTEKDITNTTLLQILVEMETGTTQFLSPDMLRQLILLAHHPMHASMKSMLEQMMNVMQSQAQSNPYLDGIKQSGDVFNKQMQQFFAQWQDYLKK